jgi:hypothetical protein
LYAYFSRLGQKYSITQNYTYLTSVLNIIPCQGRAIEYLNTSYVVLWRGVA